jgi:hypothetical protein
MKETIEEVPNFIMMLGDGGDGGDGVCPNGLNSDIIAFLFLLGDFAIFLFCICGERRRLRRRTVCKGNEG